MARADALLVNLGTFDAERRDAAETALEVASEEGVPWVLDPVFIDRSEPRAALRPVAGGAEAARRSGSTAPNSPRSAARSRTARRCRAMRSITLAVIALTGTVDQITDGARRVEIENGHPLMARVTAMGCAASALVGAFLAVESDRARGERGGAALLRRRRRSSRASARRGPGSFATAILDALYALDRDTLIEQGKGADDAWMCGSTRSSIRSAPNGRRARRAGAPASWPGGATLIQLRDKHGTTPAHDRTGARHQGGARRHRRAAGR